MQIFSRVIALIWLLPFGAEAKTIDEIIDVVKAEIVNPLIGFMMVLAGLFFLYGVVEFIMGASNEEARTTGKKHMIWGLAGLVIMVGVYAIIEVFQNFFNAIQ